MSQLSLFCLFLVTVAFAQEENFFNLTRFTEPVFRDLDLNFKPDIEIPMPKRNFPCRKIAPQNPVPIDATKLLFSDLKAVMALGDSVTAAFAMYRGWSGIMGADHDAESLVNYIKKVGQPVKGGSVDRGLPWGGIRWPWPIRPHNPPVDKLNGAQSRAKIENISKQIDYLLSQAPKEGVDINKDWKFLNIFIGGNNLFRCKDPEAHPDFFEKNLHDAISKVNATMPRVFISIMPIFSQAFMDVYNNGKDDWYCLFMWRLFNLDCLLDSDDTRQRIVNLSIEYNKRIYKVVQYWNSRRKLDLFVAIQPFLTQLRLPDRSSVSKFDCFHPSYKTNVEMGITLWNSLQLPNEKKPTSQMTNFVCPTDKTYLQ